MTGTDSAGVPWRGRSFTPSGFEGDDGTADPRLASALAAHQAGDAGLDDVVAALAGARLLVPVVATRGEEAAEMAVVTLRGTDGRVALPVFSSVAALAAWDAAARPVPVEARRAALSAVDSGTDVLALDVAGPVTVVVPRPAVWAVAQGRSWVPSPRDREVAAAVRAAVTAVPGVDDVRCEPGERAELRVVLLVSPGLDADGVRALTEAVSGHLAASEVVAERVDSLELRVLPTPRRV